MSLVRGGLAVLWREPGVSQVGTDPRCRVVLEGLSEGEQRLLDRLAVVATPADLVRAGQVLEVPERRVRDLVARLDAGGVLAGRAASRGAPSAREPGPDVAYWSRLRPDGDGWAVPRTRSGAVVAVLGLDGLGLRVGTGLAVAGVGTVLAADTGPVLASDVAPGAYASDDVGRRRDEAAAEALRRAEPRVRTGAPPGARPHVTVLVEHGVASPVRARPLVREDLAHLSVVVGDVDVTVGPLVVPGTGPCLRCLDLHRCDADPRWPAVATQVAADPPDGVESSLGPLAAALAVGQVLAHLDGRAPASRGATLQVDAVDPVPRRTPWPVHADCGCTGVDPPRDDPATST